MISGSYGMLQYEFLLHSIYDHYNENFKSNLCSTLYIVIINVHVQ